MKLLILDGNSVINRAYFGVKPLTTRDGLYTHAIYGFLNILERMEKEEQPEAVCVAFDLHGPTFRHLKYDGYKATRHGMPDELAQQMPVLKELLTDLGYRQVTAEGWEADDILGTAGRICAASDWDCVIVTGNSLLQAFDRLEASGLSANSILDSQSLGSIVHISEAEIAELKTAFHLEG